jgi:hypothetical protein
MKRYMERTLAVLALMFLGSETIHAQYRQQDGYSSQNYFVMTPSAEQKPNLHLGQGVPGSNGKSIDQKADEIAYQAGIELPEMLRQSFKFFGYMNSQSGSIMLYLDELKNSWTSITFYKRNGLIIKGYVDAFGLYEFRKLETGVTVKANFPDVFSKPL